MQFTPRLALALQTHIIPLVEDIELTPDKIVFTTRCGQVLVLTASYTDRCVDSNCASFFLSEDGVTVLQFQTSYRFWVVMKLVQFFEDLEKQRIIKDATDEVVQAFAKHVNGESHEDVQTLHDQALDTLEVTGLESPHRKTLLPIASYYYALLTRAN